MYFQVPGLTLIGPAESHVHFKTNHCGQGRGNALSDRAELALGHLEPHELRVGEGQSSTKNWGAIQEGSWVLNGQSTTFTGVLVYWGFCIGHAKLLPFPPQSDSWKHKQRKWIPPVTDRGPRMNPMLGWLIRYSFFHQLMDPWVASSAGSDPPTHTPCPSSDHWSHSVLPFRADAALYSH